MQNILIFYAKLSHFLCKIVSFFTQTPVQQIKQNNNHTRVHSFGLGEASSKYLVIEAAKAGKGFYSFISDNSTSLELKVLKALREASKPCFTDIQINWNSLASALKYSGRYNTTIDNVYEEEPISIFAIFDKEKLMKILKDQKTSDLNNIKISMINTLTHKDECLNVKLDLNALSIQSDPVCSSLAAKHHINYLESLSKSELESSDTLIIGKDTESSTSLSLKYKVLCSSTSYFGKVKNLNKSSKEMKKCEVSISKLKSEDLYGYRDRSSTRFKTKAKAKDMLIGSCDIPDCISNWKNIKGYSIPLQQNGLSFLSKKSWYPLENCYLKIYDNSTQFNSAPLQEQICSNDIGMNLSRLSNPSVLGFGCRGGRGGSIGDKGGSIAGRGGKLPTRSRLLCKKSEEMESSSQDEDRCLDKDRRQKSRSRSRSGSRLKRCSRSSSDMSDFCAEESNSRSKIKGAKKSATKIKAEKIIYESKELSKTQSEEKYTKDKNRNRSNSNDKNFENESCQPNFNGSFSSLPSKYKSIINQSYPYEISSLTVSSTQKELLWLTLIAICIIKTLSPSSSSSSSTNIFCKIRSNPILGSTLIKKSLKFLSSLNLSNIDSLISKVTAQVAKIN